jgi:predicted aspartyl protease
MAPVAPVTSERFPYLPIRLSVDQQVIDVEALVDTGFNGDLVMPLDLIGGVTPSSHLYWALADGSPVRAPVYRGAVQLGSLGTFPILVTALGDEPIIGRGLTDRFRVILDHGRRLIVEP